MPLTLVTWNLHGSAGVPVQPVVDHLRGERADLVLLQEVQRPQATAIADALGAGAHWSFKHWPVVSRPEGLAVLAPRVHVRVSTLELTARWRVWSWRRRIAQEVGLDVDGLPVHLLHAHLTPHPAKSADREREMAELLRRPADRRTAVVAGDLNERPGGPAIASAVDAGLRDAWVTVPAPGAGNTSWGRTAAAPSQRLDYVLVGASLRVERVSVPEQDPDCSWRDLSDHLPLTVRISALRPTVDACA